MPPKRGASKKTVQKKKPANKRWPPRSQLKGAPGKNSKTFKAGLKALTKLWEDAREEREDDA